MFDPSRLLDQMVRSGFGQKKKKKKKPKGVGGAAFGGVEALAHRAGVPGGGLGLLAGVAIAAFEHFNQQRTTGTAGPGHMPPPTATPPPPPLPAGARPAVAPPPPPSPMTRPVERPVSGAAGAPGERGSAVVVDDRPEAAVEKAMLLVEAMIEAAKADRMIDPGERAKILARLEEAGAGREERSFVDARMALPPAPQRLVERVRPDDPANRLLAAEVYVASLIAIEVDTQAARAYLRDLGKRLQLDDGLIGHLHDDLGVERP